ncbi:MAG: hypothetical protein Q8Q42_03875 [Nanoarchaeota archaeon]|nr:hypothetical protein [Nanoarchaeota archaeon]
MKRGGNSYLTISFLFLLVLSVFLVSAQGKIGDVKEDEIPNADTINDETLSDEIDAIKEQTDNLIDTIVDPLENEIDGKETPSGGMGAVGAVGERIIKWTSGIISGKRDDSVTIGVLKETKEDQDKAVQQAINLQGRKKAIENTKELVNDEREKREQKNIEVPRSVIKTMDNSADSGPVINMLKGWFRKIGFSPVQDPKLIGFNHNPLNFEECIGDSEDDTCSLSLYVSNVNPRYVSGSGEFSFIVGNVLEYGEPGSWTVRWSDSIVLLDFDDSTENDVLTYNLTPFSSSIFAVKVCNYLNGDVACSNTLFLQVFGLEENNRPKLLAVSPDPVDFNAMTPNPDGTYTVLFNGENFYPPRVVERIPYSVLVLMVPGEEELQVIPFDYIDSETVEVHTDRSVNDIMGVQAFMYNVINEKTYVSDAFEFNVLTGNSDDFGFEIGLPVDMTLARAVPARYYGLPVTDFASPDPGEYVKCGMPIAQPSLITTNGQGHASMTLESNSNYPYQITTTSSWPGYNPEYAGEYFSGNEGQEYARWVLVETLADLDGTQREDEFTLMRGGDGASTGNYLCNDVGSAIEIDTGKIKARINKDFSNGIEEASLINPGGSLTKVIDSTKLARAGVVVKDRPSGKVYSSEHGNVEVTRNGPVSCKITVDGPLTDGSDHYMDYSTSITFVKGSADIDVDVTYENDVNTLNFNREFEYAEFVVGVEGNSGQASFSNANNEANPIIIDLGLNDAGSAHYGNVTNNAEAGHGWVPYINNYRGYRVLKGGTVLQDTQNEGVYPRYFTAVYSPASSDIYLAISAKDAPGNNWPVGLKATGFGDVRFQFYADETPSVAKEFHLEYAAHKTKMFAMHLGKIGEVGSMINAHNDMIERLKSKQFYPFCFASDYDYYRKTGGFAGNDGSILMPNTFYPLITPITVDEQRAVDAKISDKLGQVANYDILIDNAWFKPILQIWNNQPGYGGVTNSHSFNYPLMALRAGAEGQFPGGVLLNYQNVAEFWSDTGVVHNDGLNYGDSGYGTNAQNPHGGSHSQNLEPGHFQIQIINQVAQLLGEDRLQESFIEGMEWNKAQDYWNGRYLRGFARLLRSLAYGYLEYGNPNDLQHMQQRLPAMISSRTVYNWTTYDGRWWSQLTPGWLCDPGEDYDIEEMEVQSAVDQHVDKATVPSCGYFDGQNYANSCGISGTVQDYNRPWQVAELASALKAAEVALPASQLKDDTGTRVQDLAKYLNIDNMDDPVWFDYNNPGNSKSYYAYCFAIDNPDPYLPDYDVIALPFLWAYERTGDDAWLEKGLMWYMTQAASSSYGNPGSGLMQGLLYEADKSGYLDN